MGDALAPLDPGLEAALRRVIGEPARVLVRAIDRAAYASDASVYRLVPQAVVQPQSEAEVRGLFALSQERGVPMTFRTAGTSLSGQAVSDGLLVDLSKHWSRVEVLDGGERVRVQPGVIGGHVNAVLRRWDRRIGPDPASIDTCMMGGILANNSSGMCCGVRENAYQTLDSLRCILPNGLTIDTADPEAGERLLEGAPAVYHGLLDLKRRIEGDLELTARIRRKYRIKNTMGYSLNAFLDHDRPEQILAHLLIGSEGTLAFIAEAVLRTLPEHRLHRTGLLLFRTAASAFAAVAPFERSGARAIEFMDDACLRTARTFGLLDLPVETGPGSAALLVEYQCATADELAGFREAETAVLASLDLLAPARLTEKPAERVALWKMRKGLIPTVGATKRSGEAVLIEDVAFPLPQLPAATAELQELFVRHGYGNAILFGHAKDGNLHFVLTQSFNDAPEIARFEGFLAALAELVIRHDGSLKAEHGTGRNMAPFVEAEWGSTAMAVMREIKALLDPHGLLNPGVVINPDPRAHVKHLKDLPTVDPEVDRCIECGFCEPACPSRRLTLTPRQRITVRREMVRQEDGEILDELRRDFQYAGIDTCAGDGMCSTACPVKIDTGKLIKRLRGEQHDPRARRAAARLARHLGTVERLARLAVRTGHLAERLMGVAALQSLTRTAGKMLGRRLPVWSGAIPRVPRAPHPPAPSPIPSQPPGEGENNGAEAVYMPACLSRVMGWPRGEERSLSETLRTLAERAGVRLRAPSSAGQCCGLPFGSKGFTAAHAETLERLVQHLWKESGEGKLPIVLDASSCLHSILTSGAILGEESQRRLGSLRLVDAMRFVHDTLLPRLDVQRQELRIALHPTCAARHMGLVEEMRRIAEHCASEVEVPVNLTCCAMAGDRGLLFPELNASAVAPEAAEVLAGEFDRCYSNNLTCEIGMTQATGREYVSLLYLVEAATRGLTPDPSPIALPAPGRGAPPPVPSR
jgi:D-lactate dehydrogenase